MNQESPTSRGGSMSTTVNTQTSSNDITMSPPQDFTIKSGLTATEQAFMQLFDTLERGELAKLGFPLFFFLLSTVTSIVALYMAFNLSESDDVKDSWDKSDREEKLAIIFAAREGLDKNSGLN